MAGLQICVIALGIVSNNPAHNLLCPKTLAFMLDCIFSRRVRAIVAGPPCETWSAVRERALKSGACKVLRTLIDSWGKKGLRPKQFDQLQIANELLLTALLMTSAVMLAGGTALIEHPAEPRGDESCSIWRLPIVKRITQAPCAEITTVWQGPLGQVSPKPIGLLAIRAPHVQKMADLFSIRNRVVSAAPQFRENGTFGTAILKEYPPRFSAVLLMSIWSSARNPWEHAGDFDTAVGELLLRCRFIEEGSGDCLTPRSNVVPYPSMRFLSVWPSEGAAIGPDFNVDAARRIKEVEKNNTSPQDALRMARGFVQETLT